MAVRVGEHSGEFSIAMRIHKFRMGYCVFGFRHFPILRLDDLLKALLNLTWTLAGPRLHRRGYFGRCCPRRSAASARNDKYGAAGARPVIPLVCRSRLGRSSVGSV